MKKLLIADDEDGIRRLVRMTLESDEYEILEASNGADALSLARLERPELLLLDVTMPHADGFEVCRMLKDDPETAGIFIVMLTARTEEADQVRAREARADDYFTKPFSPVALMDKVHDIFGGSPAG